MKWAQRLLVTGGFIGGSWWSVGYNLGLNHRGLWRVFPYAYELLECVKGPQVHKRFLFHLVQAVYLTVVGGGRSAGGKFQPFLYFLAISSSFFFFFSASFLSLAWGVGFHFMLFFRFWVISEVFGEIWVRESLVYVCVYGRERSLGERDECLLFFLVFWALRARALVSGKERGEFFVFFLDFFFLGREYLDKK